MTLSSSDLHKIVAKASTIFERIENGYIPIEDSESIEIANNRLHKWCQTSSRGDWNRFYRRLEWASIDLNKVLPLLGNVRMPFEKLMPDWVDTLNDCLNYIHSPKHNATLPNYRFLKAESPLQFEDILSPCVNYAQEKLRSRAQGKYERLSEKAHGTLERSLLQSLINIFSKTFQAEFSIFRSTKEPALSRLIRKSKGLTTRKLYNQFVHQMLDGAVIPFLKEYCVLARLLAVTVKLWIEASTEFLDRLDSDWHDISRTFNNDRNLQHVVNVQVDISDRHKGGRFVIVLQFDSRVKVVYKPKNIQSEKAFNRLLFWFNQYGTSSDFKVLKVIDRTEYGWVEFVERLSCNNEEDVKKYYQRTGKLLCLIYILGGTDCHNENIIAHGEYPVLVDTETLMHPYFVEEEHKLHPSSDTLAQEQMWRSVLRTGMLPRWMTGPNGESYDISGLGGTEEHITHQEVPTWENINTDDMSLFFKHSTIQPKANLPICNGTAISAKNYEHDLIQGFKEMYWFLLDVRKLILSSNGPLKSFQQSKVRFVFRDTRVCNLMLQKLSFPEYMRDGVKRSIEIDALNIAFTGASSKPSSWPLLSAEEKSLAQLDIPLFNTYTNSVELIIFPDETISGLFTQDSFSLVVEAIQEMSLIDLEKQIHFIHSSFISRFVVNTSINDDAKFNKKVSVQKFPQPKPEQYINQALTLANELQRQALELQSGDATWIALEMLPRVERMQFQPIGQTFYSGSAGIGLFLAALTKITGDSNFRKLSTSAVFSLRKNINNNIEQLVQKMGIGGALGIGSVIYVLTRMGVFLEDESLIRDARASAESITSRLIDLDRRYDIIDGAAGTILGLLTLYHIYPDDEIVERAYCCGLHLLNNRIISDSGHRVWATMHKTLLTGISHGATGIAYALLKLYELTKNSSFKEATLEAIAYERSVFDSKANNWPDFRYARNENGIPFFSTNWCHGAPGIGLGRIGGLSVLNDREVRKEIEIAIETTQKFGVRGVDHLCCGNFGRIEFLLKASLSLSRNELFKTAHQWAYQVIHKVQEKGTYDLMPNLPKSVNNPGFFQGTSGIGYELLRLAYPDILPSTLLWE